MSTPREPKIYLLPNLMTAGNLFCGFASTLRIIEAGLAAQKGEPVVMLYHQALAFILGACVFDLLDGRLARLGGHESRFGQEFDSLADIVSFGIAPALLVYQIVLVDFHRTGWLIAFVYLLCGAMRLARFNCYAWEAEHSPQKNEDGTPKKIDDFIGFPIPAAAGLIASLTLFMLWLEEGTLEIGPWKFALPALLLFLSFMMFSRVKYPSFKGLGWRTQRSGPKFMLFSIILVIAVVCYEWMPAVLFVAFLLYGFIRPFISMAWRRQIEEDDEDDEEEKPAPPDPGI